MKSKPCCGGGDDDVKRIVSAEGASPVTPLVTLALVHVTDVCAVILSEFTVLPVPEASVALAVTTRLVVAEPSTLKSAKVATPAIAVTVDVTTTLPVPEAFVIVTARTESAPVETTRPEES